MSKNPDANIHLMSEEREKMLLYRQRVDGKVDVFIYYPESDKYKHYIATFALSIKGHGATLRGEDMDAILRGEPVDKVWNIGLTTFFWRDK